MNLKKKDRDLKLNPAYHPRVDISNILYLPTRYLDHTFYILLGPYNHKWLCIIDTHDSLVRDTHVGAIIPILRHLTTRPISHPTFPMSWQTVAINVAFSFNRDRSDQVIIVENAHHPLIRDAHVGVVIPVVVRLAEHSAAGREVLERHCYTPVCTRDYTVVSLFHISLILFIDRRL